MALGQQTGTLRRPIDVESANRKTNTVEPRFGGHFLNRPTSSFKRDLVSKRGVTIWIGYTFSWHLVKMRFFGVLDQFREDQCSPGGGPLYGGFSFRGDKDGQPRIQPARNPLTNIGPFPFRNRAKIPERKINLPRGGFQGPGSRPVTKGEGSGNNNWAPGAGPKKAQEKPFPGKFSRRKFKGAPRGAPSENRGLRGRALF